MIGLLVYPTHENLAEELVRYEDAGIDAKKYPVRSTVATEHREQNCWNDEADKAQNIGLPVVATICPTCKHKHECQLTGYLAQTYAAQGADVSLATHQRAATSGFADLISDRQYTAVHENALDVLRPGLRLSVQDLYVVREFVFRLSSDPFYLDFFGDGNRKDEDGNIYHDEEQLLRRQRLYQSCLALSDLIDHLTQQLHEATVNTPWQPPKILDTPTGFESFLWWALLSNRITFQGSPWQFLLAALTGKLYAAMIVVSQRHVKGAAQGSVKTVKSIFGVVKNNPPSGRNIWFCDATASHDVLAAVLDGPIHDKTPDGTVALQQKALQYHRDITRRTTPKILLSLIRGLLCRYPDRQNVGLIVHSNHVGYLEQLEPEFARWIIKTSYYGSGDERSSNAWHHECDLLLILGTPRVPQETVVEYLVQIGELEAACQQPVWDEFYWHGMTVSGEEQRFQGRGYRDPTWRKAHQSIVRAALVQAIGRGRGILADGCDVIVLSSEECGLPIIDGPAPFLNESAVQLWQFIDQLTAKKPNRYLYRKVAVSTAELALASDLPIRTCRRLLTELESFNLVQRDGPRSDWYLTPLKSSSSDGHETDEVASLIKDYSHAD